MAKRESPRACPKCGTLAVERVNGEWHCCRDGCGHCSEKPFPLLRSLKVGRGEPHHRWQYGVGSGHRYMPAGNKHS